MVHFSLTSVAFFLGTIAASASTVHSRDGMSHKRASSIKTKFTDGEVSVYHPSLGACGYANSDSSQVVSLSAADWVDGAFCMKWVQIDYNGRQGQGQVVDKCISCPSGSLEVSPFVFNEVEEYKNDTQTIIADWEFIHL
ncbi:riboflavin-aldehyde forming enzyme [Pyrrhoderma noxium]|uniref:Riboflavin-aldehyde forming enzyme n=1 Tax=Pyrrhoderma noxium TaxID=2282107 RepID=A0A286UAT0_9AGAM|nr:riboflavin-aldehyde forming enzyme [Pyrrhoderma noxium]